MTQSTMITAITDFSTEVIVSFETTFMLAFSGFVVIQIIRVDRMGISKDDHTLKT